MPAISPTAFDLSCTHTATVRIWEPIREPTRRQVLAPVVLSIWSIPDRILVPRLMDCRFHQRKDPPHGFEQTVPFVPSLAYTSPCAFGEQFSQSWGHTSLRAEDCGWQAGACPVRNQTAGEFTRSTQQCAEFHSSVQNYKQKDLYSWKTQALRLKYPLSQQTDLSTGRVNLTACLDFLVNARHFQFASMPSVHFSPCPMVRCFTMFDHSLHI